MPKGSGLKVRWEQCEKIARNIGGITKTQVNRQYYKLLSEAGCLEDAIEGRDISVIREFLDLPVDQPTIALEETITKLTERLESPEIVNVREIDDNLPLPMRTEHEFDFDLATRVVRLSEQIEVEKQVIIPPAPVVTPKVETKKKPIQLSYGVIPNAMKPRPQIQTERRPAPDIELMEPGTYTVSDSVLRPKRSMGVSESTSHQVLKTYVDVVENNMPFRVLYHKAPNMQAAEAWVKRERPDFHPDSVAYVTSINDI